MQKMRKVTFFNRGVFWVFYYGGHWPERGTPFRIDFWLQNCFFSKGICVNPARHKSAVMQGRGRLEVRHNCRKIIWIDQKGFNTNPKGGTRLWKHDRHGFAKSTFGHKGPIIQYQVDTCSARTPISPRGTHIFLKLIPRNGASGRTFVKNPWRKALRIELEACSLGFPY